MFSCAKESFFRYPSVQTKNLIVHCGRVDAFLEFFLLGSESWLVVTTSSLLPEKQKTMYCILQSTMFNFLLFHYIPTKVI